MADTKRNTFTKEQLLNSEKYRNKRDILRAVLEDDKKYSIAEADKQIENFLKGEVK